MSSVGWRGRIGFINPSSVTSTPAYEFYKMVPEGVSLIATPLGINGITNEQVEEALSNLDTCVQKLIKFNADIVILGGSPTAAHLGIQGEQDTCRRLTETHSLTFTTSQLAAIHAMNALQIKNPVVVTPFSDEQNAKVIKYLEGHHLQIQALQNIHLDHHGDCRLLGSETPYRLAKKAVASATGPVDGIYIPCGAWPTIDMIEMLERDTGLPVVTSTQAMVWKALNLIEVFDPIVGFGSLFATKVDSIC
jgi:maleate isomerase